MDVCIHVWMYICIYVFMYICMYVYVSMYVCMFDKPDDMTFAWCIRQAGHSVHLWSQMTSDVGMQCGLKIRLCVSRQWVLCGLAMDRKHCTNRTALVVWSAFDFPLDNSFCFFSSTVGRSQRGNQTSMTMARVMWCALAPSRILDTAMSTWTENIQYYVAVACYSRRRKVTQNNKKKAFQRTD